MTTQTKIIIGLSVVVAVLTGVLIRQLVKSGEDRAEIKFHRKALSEKDAQITFLEDYAKEIEEKLIHEKGNVARLALREQIYLDKIKIDSALLKEVQTSNERIDSLSSTYNLDDWNKLISTEIEVPDN